MDGDRSSNLKELVNEFLHVTNNEKAISEFRTAIASGDLDNNKNVRNMTSHIKFSVMKNLFFSSVPHNIKSKIEKIIAERIAKHGRVDAMQAVIVFAAIFGIIVIATVILKTVGGK
jgi:uncharacterized DUF497 family protein